MFPRHDNPRTATCNEARRDDNIIILSSYIYRGGGEAAAATADVNKTVKTLLVVKLYDCIYIYTSRCRRDGGCAMYARRPWRTALHARLDSFSNFRKCQTRLPFPSPRASRRIRRLMPSTCNIYIRLYDRNEHSSARELVPPARPRSIVVVVVQSVRSRTSPRAKRCLV